MAAAQTLSAYKMSTLDQRRDCKLVESVEVKDSVLPPQYDQGQSGTCFAYAAVAVLQTYLNYSKKNTNESISVLQAIMNEDCHRMFRNGGTAAEILVSLRGKKVTNTYDDEVHPEVFQELADLLRTGHEFTEEQVDQIVELLDFRVGPAEVIKILTDNFKLGRTEQNLFDLYQARLSGVEETGRRRRHSVDAPENERSDEEDSDGDETESPSRTKVRRRANSTLAKPKGVKVSAAYNVFRTPLASDLGLGTGEEWSNVANRILLEKMVPSKKNRTRVLPVVLSFCPDMIVDGSGTKCDGDTHAVVVTGSRTYDCGGEIETEWKVLNSYGGEDQGWIELETLKPHILALKTGSFLSGVKPCHQGFHFSRDFLEQCREEILTQDNRIFNQFVENIQVHNKKGIQNLASQHPEIIFSNDPSGVSPLHVAAVNDPSILAFLLETTEFKRYQLHTKSIVDLPDQLDRTPLFYAVLMDNVQNIKKLLRTGADPNYRDVAGNAPIHHACRLGNYESALELLRAGSQVDFANKKGENPLSYATKSGNQKLIDLLLSIQRP